MSITSPREIVRATNMPPSSGFTLKASLDDALDVGHFSSRRARP
jgi:hypothetical protein